jgi:protein-tyrosine phosphatase
MSSVAERIPLADAPPSEALVERVGAALAAGGLVCMPTETVYGVAARADSDAALGALRALKGRAAREPLTWHVADRGVVERFPHLRPLARRLVQRYWPGPLTLVLEGVPPGLERVARDGWTGVRLPAHRGTAGLLARLSFPVVLSSVNRSGESPLLDAEEILARFGAGFALVLDGGPSRIGEPSGVLKLGRGSFELLREGLVSADDLRSSAGLALGFCCTGNTCRSPMAEALARRELAQRLGVAPGRIGRFGFRVRSMGIAAHVGAPASEHAATVIKDQGGDLSAHRSRQATLEDVLALDRIYGMTPAHVEALRSLLPPARAGMVELLDPAGHAIQDPVGGPLGVYRESMEEIAAAVKRRAAEWA